VITGFLPQEIIVKLARHLHAATGERVRLRYDGHDANIADLGRQLAEAAEMNVRVRRLKRRDDGRNGPCPCGSGRKYKRCCARTGLVYGRVEAERFYPAPAIGGASGTNGMERSDADDG